MTSQPPNPSLVLAQQCYDKLAQALVPIREAIQDLEQDWKPRTPAFWNRLVACLAQLQQEVNACLAIASTASIAHRSCLYYVIGCIEEVGIRLTAYQATSSLAQKHLRQRQVVLHALRELYEEAQKTLIDGRAWLNQVQQDQNPLGTLIAKNATSSASRTPLSHERRPAPTGSRANARRHLRLVECQEPEVDMSDTQR